MKSDQRRHLNKLFLDLVAQSELQHDDVLTYGSFFSGMECPLVGLENALTTDGDHSRALVCEFGVDISPHCLGVIKNNFGHKKLYKDVTMVKIKDMAPVDLL